MAGKNAYARWVAINNMLKTGRKYNWEMLATVCENAEGVRERPQKRTIQEDIRILREKFGAPIPKRCSEGLWYYTDTNFSINDNPLYYRDVELLEQVKNVIAQFPELTFSKSLDEIIQKLQKNLSIKPVRSPKIIQFEKNKSIVIANYLEVVYNAILEKKVLQFSYHPFTLDEPMKIFVHPYFLKQYNSRWFLVAWQETEKRLWHFGLERIKEIFSSEKIYKSNESIEPATYFNSVIGVTIPDNEKIQTVQLQISAQRTPYIITKPLHPSQKEVKKTKSNDMIIELRVIPNFELRALILSHGSAIKVLKPKSLVEAMQKEIAEMQKAYTEK